MGTLARRGVTENLWQGLHSAAPLGIVVYMSTPTTNLKGHQMSKAANGQEVHINGHSVMVEVDHVRFAAIPADLVREVANAAWRQLRHGADQYEASVSALRNSGMDPWDIDAIVNCAAGRCPDGCCGAGADYPHTPTSLGLFRAQHPHMA
jgi:hypothetical protein